MSLFGVRDLLDCYARGVFPMADAREDARVFLIDPERRGVIPLDGFHVSRRLARTVRSDRFAVRVDTAFHNVVLACAASGPGRTETWINRPIEKLYGELHARGHAHSVECWQEGELVGGLYGVSLGGAFFGESMFSRRRDASKVALVHLVGRLIAGGYRLLDTQFMTEHLAQFGAVEVARAEYHRRLARALAVEADFYGVTGPASTALGAGSAVALGGGEILGGGDDPAVALGAGSATALVGGDDGAAALGAGVGEPLVAGASDGRGSIAAGGLEAGGRGGAVVTGVTGALVLQLIAQTS